MFGRHYHKIRLSTPLQRGMCEVLAAIEFLQKTGETVVAIKIDHTDARFFDNDFIARIVTIRKGNGKADEQHS